MTHAHRNSILFITHKQHNTIIPQYYNTTLAVIARTVIAVQTTDRLHAECLPERVGERERERARERERERERQREDSFQIEKC